jgi:hypothetical protein
MNPDQFTFIFAKWSGYDQIVKRRLEALRLKGKYPNAKIIEAMEPQEVLDLDRGNPGPTTPVAIVSTAVETKVYRGKEIEALFG